MVKKGFSISTNARDYFSEYRIPLTCSWSEKEHGAIQRHIPSIIESHFENISSKIDLLDFSTNRLLQLLAKLSRGYDPAKTELKINKIDSNEAELMINYFVIELRSVLEIFVQLNILLFPKGNYPRSFNDFLKSKKYNEEVLGRDYYLALKKVERSKWLEYLISPNKSKRLCARDLRTHFSHLYIWYIPEKNKIKIVARVSKSVNQFWLKADQEFEVCEFIKDSMNGLISFLADYKKCFPPEYFKKMLVENGYKPRFTDNPATKENLKL